MLVGLFVALSLSANIKFNKFEDLGKIPIVADLASGESDNVPEIASPAPSPPKTQEVPSPAPTAATLPADSDIKKFCGEAPYSTYTDSYNTLLFAEGTLNQCIAIPGASGYFFNAPNPTQKYKVSFKKFSGYDEAATEVAGSLRNSDQTVGIAVEAGSKVIALIQAEAEQTINVFTIKPAATSTVDYHPYVSLKTTTFKVNTSAPFSDYSVILHSQLSISAGTGTSDSPASVAKKALENEVQYTAYKSEGYLTIGAEPKTVQGPVTFSTSLTTAIDIIVDAVDTTVNPWPEALQTEGAISANYLAFDKAAAIGGSDDDYVPPNYGQKDGGTDDDDGGGNGGAIAGGVIGGVVVVGAAVAGVLYFKNKKEDNEEIPKKDNADEEAKSTNTTSLTANDTTEV